jgi:NADH pyrophosphatase NudC (nudix superfamily)
MNKEQEIRKIQGLFYKLDLKLPKEMEQFLMTQTQEQFNNWIDHLRFTAECGKEELEKGGKIRWCAGKKTILIDDDCKSPVNFSGCVNWDGEKCKKEAKS